jgi:hypothetical protein
VVFLSCICVFDPGAAIRPHDHGRIVVLLKFEVFSRGESGDGDMA